MAGRTFTKTEQKHEHFFQKGLCECGCEQITIAEFESRKSAWEEYYKKVRETLSFKSFISCKDAFTKRNMRIVKELAEQAKERLSVENFLPKPKFLDPEYAQYRGKLWIRYSIADQTLPNYMQEGLAL